MFVNILKDFHELGNNSKEFRKVHDVNMCWIKHGCKNMILLLNKFERLELKCLLKNLHFISTKKFFIKYFYLYNVSSPMMKHLDAYRDIIGIFQNIFISDVHKIINEKKKDYIISMNDIKDRRDYLRNMKYNINFALK